MAAPPEKLQALLDELSMLEDPAMRADLLIEYAERFCEVPEHIATRPFPERFRVPSCESDAFIFPEQLPGGGIKWHFAVENPQGISAKALCTIIDETLSGADPQEIAAVSDELVYDIFGRELSMGKGLGLRSMVQLVQALAAAPRREK